MKDSYLKDSYFPILLTLWFRYLKIYIKENCMYLSSQLFFKTPHITRKFQEKCICQQSADLNFKTFLLSVYHVATPRVHWTKQTVNKTESWILECLDKSLSGVLTRSFLILIVMPYLTGSLSSRVLQYNQNFQRYKPNCINYM